MIDIENIKKTVGSVCCPECGKENSHVLFLRDRLRYNEAVILYHKYDGTTMKYVYGVLRPCKLSRSSWTFCPIHDKLFQKTFPGIDLIEVKKIIDNLRCPLCYNRVDGFEVNISNHERKRPVRLIHEVRYNEEKTGVCSRSSCDISISEFYDAIDLNS
jgi:hypothetical protein